MEIQKSKGTNTKKIIVEKEKEKKGKKKTPCSGGKYASRRLVDRLPLSAWNMNGIALNGRDTYDKPANTPFHDRSRVKHEIECNEWASDALRQRIKRSTISSKPWRRRITKSEKTEKWNLIAEREVRSWLEGNGIVGRIDAEWNRNITSHHHASGHNTSPIISICAEQKCSTKHIQKLTAVVLVADDVVAVIFTSCQRAPEKWFLLIRKLRGWQKPTHGDGKRNQPMCTRTSASKEMPGALLTAHRIDAKIIQWSH